MDSPHEHARSASSAQEIDHEISVNGDSASRYCDLLLKDLQHRGQHVAFDAVHPAISWALSGLAEITGISSGPPLAPPVALSACADGALMALRSISGKTLLAGSQGSVILGERSRLVGLSRRGLVSPGGQCRLLQARDGWIGLSLARAEDWASVEAWLNANTDPDWQAIGAAVSRTSVDELLDRACLIGLPAGRHQAPTNRPWRTQYQCGEQRVGPPPVRPLVVDLSSLWAGPLCASLFSNLGARVVKVETFQRPDGARNGNSTFYDLLNEGKDSIVLNFANAGEVAALIRLLLSADIVVDSSRPRALHSLGIQAEEIVRRRRGQTWISITGHGRLEPHGNRAGFGDDCAVEAGLSWLMERAYGLPLFCGDAISDPLTGLHAALAGWACFQKGGGSVVSLALTDVVAHCIAAAPSDDLAARQRIWNTIGGGFEDERYPLRRPRNVAAGIGQHTDQVLAELAC